MDLVNCFAKKLNKNKPPKCFIKTRTPDEIPPEVICALKIIVYSAKTPKTSPKAYHAKTPSFTEILELSCDLGQGA